MLGDGWDENSPLPNDWAVGVVYGTVNPDIVKTIYVQGMTLPTGAALSTDSNGTQWVYYPTATALAMGQVVAAVDTITAIPAQVAQTVSSAASAISSYGLPLLIGGGILAVLIFLKK